MPRNDETAITVRNMLEDRDLTQRALADRMSGRLGWHIDQSRISRGMRDPDELSPAEKRVMVQILDQRGRLTPEQLVWLGERLKLSYRTLAELVPLPVTTNLPLPDDRPYLIPPSYELLKARLTAGRRGEDLYSTRYSALIGPPGSGKTALLEHLAFDGEVYVQFPAILYANLNGASSPLPALHQWLALLEKPLVGLDEAKRILCRELERKPTLLLLDDLPDARFVPDLLVGGGGSQVVLVCAQNVAVEANVPPAATFLHEGWDGSMACRYLEAAWGRSLAAEERVWAGQINELVDGLSLAWTLLAPWLRRPESWAEIRTALAATPLTVLSRSHDRLWTSLNLAYERLLPPAQDLFRAMGVLAPGAPFDLEALVAILSLPPAEVRWRLDALEMAAFLRDAPSGSGQNRYQMHHLLHHLARELARSDPEHQVQAEHHARFYAGRGHPLRAEQNSPEWSRTVRELLPDLPNVRLGQAWAAERAHPLAVDYFLNTAPYLLATRDLETHLAWGQAALPVVEADPAAFPALERLAVYGQLPHPDPSQKQAYLEQALTIAREEMGEDATSYQVYSLCWLARFLYEEAGQAMEAVPVLAEALALAAGRGRPALETHVLGEVASFFLLLHDRAGLEVLAGRLPANPPGMHAAGLSGAHYHGVRADVLRAVGRWAEAEAAYDQVIALHDDIGDERHGATARLWRALCRARRGDVEGRDEDLAWVGERLAGSSVAGQVRYQLTMSELALSVGEAQRALEALQALPEGWQAELDRSMGRSRYSLALEAWLMWRQVYLALGHSAEAEAATAQVQAAAQARGFVLRFEEDQAVGQVTLSAAPDLLEQVVGGRPPLLQ